MNVDDAMRALRRDADRMFGDGGPAPGVFVASCDPEDASQRLARLYGRHRLDLRGRREAFDMRLQVASAGPLEIARLSFGASVELDQRPLRRFTLVTTQLAGRSEIADGSQMCLGGPGMVVIDSADAPAVKRFSPDSCRLHIRLDQLRLEAKCSQLLGREVRAALVFRRVLEPGSPTQARWLALLHMVLACAKPAEQGSSPLLFEQLEDMAALLLLTEVPHSRSALLAGSPPAIAPRHVKRAEEFICAHAAEALTLGDIAAAAGVSTRALAEGFRRTRQTTPMAFLREQRLLRVRAALEAAGPGSTVTDIALRWGFGNLGRFAADYRRRFGEAPAKTLRQAG
ncbi:AraC-type DNA-binding protein [Thauera chlorobenzoica]|uniref:Transcriptional regulator, AraC family n=2 Tax=Thauera chlorobenzoica TaxID=96773 RepID=A0A1H5VVF2_9RHOO|nr:Transcriptional regulator, AraC family [Thauera chlorobenzoica]SEF91279.1 AraC-type DNA-binding protein [Thauera chlorobenzoica]